MSQVFRFVLSFGSFGLTRFRNFTNHERRSTAAKEDAYFQFVVGLRVPGCL